MPPKRGIQVRFLSAGPQNNQNLSTGNVDKSIKFFLSRRFVWSDLTCLNYWQTLLIGLLRLHVKICSSALGSFMLRAVAKCSKCLKKPKNG